MRIRGLSGSLVLGGITLVLASACGGEDEDGGGSGSCGSAAKVYCQKIDECAPLLIKIAFGDTTTCTERVTIDCEADTSAPGSNTTPVNLAACVNAVAGQTCDQIFRREQPAACSVPGSRVDGEPCGADPQCESGHCNVGASDCGTCAPLSAAGGDCEEGDDCQSGLVCAEGVCATPVAIGGACSNNEQCAGAVCKSGTCAAPLGPGEACEPASSGCDALQGLYCDPQSQACKLIEFVGLGQTCGLVDGALVACAGGGSCDTGPNNQGTCVAAAADGAACDPIDGPTCTAPARCVSGSCQLPNPSGCG